MTLVQVCHDDALTFWDITIMTNEFAVFTHGIDLVQRQLILWNSLGRLVCHAWRAYWVEVARAEWSTVSVHFVEAFLNCREFVRLVGGMSWKWRAGDR